MVYIYMEVSEKKNGAAPNRANMYQYVKKPPYDIWLCLKMGYTSKIPISRGTNDYYPLNFGVRHFQTNQGFEVLQTHKSLAGTSQHARLTPPEIQVTIRFHTGFQALVDVRSDKLA